MPQDAHGAVHVFTVSPGDRVSASVAYIGQGCLQLSLVDHTTGRRFALGEVDDDFNADVADAVIVAELPRFVGKRFTLARFGSVTFTGCRADGRVFTDVGTSRIATNAGTPPISAIEMVDKSGRVIAKPSNTSSDGTSFTISEPH